MRSIEMELNDFNVSISSWSESFMFSSTSLPPQPNVGGKNISALWSIWFYPLSRNDALRHHCVIDASMFACLFPLICNYCYRVSKWEQAAPICSPSSISLRLKSVFVFFSTHFWNVSNIVVITKLRVRFRKCLIGGEVKSHGKKQPELLESLSCR